MRNTGILIALGAAALLVAGCHKPGTAANNSSDVAMENADMGSNAAVTTETVNDETSVNAAENMTGDTNMTDATSNGVGNTQ